MGVALALPVHLDRPGGLRDHNRNLGKVEVLSVDPLFPMLYRPPVSLCSSNVPQSLIFLALFERVRSEFKEDSPSPLSSINHQ